MTPLQQIKDRCRVDDLTGCWLWTGAMSEGKYPRVHAMDHTAGAKRVQTGPRAAWQAATGKAIPPGHRVYHKHCAAPACLNPAHLACGPTADWGAHLAATDAWKGQAARIQANRATGRKRSSVTPELALAFMASNQTGTALAIEHGIKRSVISNARNGKLVSVLSVANPFAGLLV